MTEKLRAKEEKLEINGGLPKRKAHPGHFLKICAVGLIGARNTD